MLALLLAVVTAGDPEVGSEITYTTTMVPLAAPTAVHWYDYESVVTMTNNADMKVTAQFALAPISSRERGLVVDSLEFFVRNTSETEFTKVDFEYES
eukprot:gene14881-32002_t